MTPRRTPQEKKQLEYKREIQRFVEYPHIARKGRPRWKARVNQAYRSRINQRLRAVDTTPEEADTALSDVRVTTRRAFAAKVTSRHLDAALPLRERLAWKKERRLVRTGWNYARRSYWTVEDGLLDRFEGFLTHAMATPSDEHRHLATAFDRVLNGGVPAPFEADYLWRALLGSFLRERPEWAPRLQAWIAQVVTGADESARDIQR